MDGVNQEFQHTLIKRPRRQRRHRNGLALVLAGVFAAIFAISYQDVNPKVDIPSPVMPSPNAYDDFARAASLLRDKNPVADAESIHSQKVYSAAQKAALVGGNGPALQALRVGLMHPYLQPPEGNFSTPVRYLSDYRAMARLLVLEAQVRGSQGDWMGAASSDLDCIQFGVAVPHGGSVIALLVGEAIESLGQRQLWYDFPHLDSGQNRTMNARLQQIVLNRSSVAQTFENEKLEGEASLLEIMQKPNWRWSMTDGLTSGSADDPVSGRIQHVLTWLRLMPYSKRQIVNNYGSYMDNLIANAGAGFSAHRPEPPMPKDPINQVLAPVFSGVIFRQTKDEAATDLLIAALALHAYKLDRYQSPQTLDQLVPDYLKSIPADPFAGSAHLRYAPGEGLDVLYSVGPDGKDDHGIPCRTTSSQRTIQADSRGDMVAGMR